MGNGGVFSDGIVNDWLGGGGVDEAVAGGGVGAVVPEEGDTSGGVAGEGVGFAGSAAVSEAER